MDELQDLWVSEEEKENVDMIFESALRAVKQLQRKDRVRNLALIGVLILTTSPFLFAVHYRENPNPGHTLMTFALAANIALYRKLRRDATPDLSLTQSMMTHTASSLSRLAEQQRFRNYTAAGTILLLALGGVVSGLRHEFLRGAACVLSALVAYGLSRVTARSVRRQIELLDTVRRTA